MCDEADEIERKANAAWKTAKEDFMAAASQHQDETEKVQKLLEELEIAKSRVQQSAAKLPSLQQKLKDAELYRQNPFANDPVPQGPSDGRRLTTFPPDAKHRGRGKGQGKKK